VCNTAYLVDGGHESEVDDLCRDPKSPVRNQGVCPRRFEPRADVGCFAFKDEQAVFSQECCNVISLLCCPNKKIHAARQFSPSNHKKYLDMKTGINKGANPS